MEHFRVALLHFLLIAKHKPASPVNAEIILLLLSSQQQYTHKLSNELGLNSEKDKYSLTGRIQLASAQALSFRQALRFSVPTVLRCNKWVNYST